MTGWGDKHQPAIVNLVSVCVGVKSVCLSWHVMLLVVCCCHCRITWSTLVSHNGTACLCIYLSHIAIWAAACTLWPALQSVFIEAPKTASFTHTLLLTLSRSYSQKPAIINLSQEVFTETIILASQKDDIFLPCIFFPSLFSQPSI